MTHMHILMTHMPNLPKPDEITKGCITKEHTVWCCEPCVKWFQISSSTKAEAIKEFKWMGWRLSKDKGWLCPDCRKKLQ